MTGFSSVKRNLGRPPLLVEGPAVAATAKLLTGAPTAVVGTVSCTVPVLLLLFSILTGDLSDLSTGVSEAGNEIELTRGAAEMGTGAAGVEENEHVEEGREAADETLAEGMGTAEDVARGAGVLAAPAVVAEGGGGGTSGGPRRMVGGCRELRPPREAGWVR